LAISQAGSGRVTGFESLDNRTGGKTAKLRFLPMSQKPNGPALRTVKEIEMGRRPREVKGSSFGTALIL
jgi:hypothetical protein